ncbi:hypothetical protein GGTG_04368 [Gaeumannomyces tritici R3-111a-1]|uniref:Uncharacterized protein n=1 Tax=Gaeumannomyces tritici (strain R3-111a-1) TaxID=644352 RepID=J3NSW9_GAET3|nr:hypothetical protein GGTG_04368 [Gaeumannomyces tritici R3-111a-1]EJT79282.1 hypothetical protein GGTG_04368 [Gaeumannomyces tritici R3-111a-1]
MGYVPMHMPTGAAQGGEPPSRPARPSRVPSGRLESIPEQRQVELGPSSQQQDRPLPGIGFVAATMGQGPPPQGYVPPDLADAMAARARQVLRAVPPRQRVDPDSPTTRLTDFLQNGGAARVASLEVMIRPPGDGPLYVEVADRNGGSAAESSSPPSSPEHPAAAGSGDSSSSKRRRAVTAPFTRQRRAKTAPTAASTVEEELLRKVELHREQLAGALAWLAHAVAERDHYSREKARLYDILERDRALYEEAVNTAPAASPPGSPKAGPAAVTTTAITITTTAAAAASPESPPPAATTAVAADDAWREWTRSSPLSWADASSPPAPPQRNHRRRLPSVPTTAGSPIAAAAPTASYLPALHPSDRPPPPPRDPRATVTAAAADKPPRHKAGMPKFRYAYGGSTAQRRQQLESHLTLWR